MTLPPLAVNLRSIRKARGMTQDELAYEAGIIQPAVSAIERGHRKGPASAVEAMARALGVDAGVLRDPMSCGNCAGEGRPGYACLTCGTVVEAVEAGDRSVAA